MVSAIFLTLLFGSYGIVTYVLTSLAYTRLLKSVGYGNIWMAWVPYFKEYSLIEAFESVISGVSIIDLKMSVKNFKILWLVITILSITSFSVIVNIPFLPILIALAQIAVIASVYNYIFAIFERKDLKSCVPISVISGLIHLVAAFKFMQYNQSNMMNNPMLASIININSTKFKPAQNGYYNGFSYHQNYTQQGMQNMQFGGQTAPFGTGQVMPNNSSPTVNPSNMQFGGQTAPFGTGQVMPNNSSPTIQFDNSQNNPFNNSVQNQQQNIQQGVNLNKV